MAALRKGLVRGVVAGGAIALIWSMLGSRRRRAAAGGVLMEGARSVPLLGPRLYAAAVEPLMHGVYREVAGEVTSEARSGELLELGTGPGYLRVEVAERAGTSISPPWSYRRTTSRWRNPGSTVRDWVGR